jgi:hypothetical protein
MVARPVASETGMRNEANRSHSAAARVTSNLWLRKRLVSEPAVGRNLAGIRFPRSIYRGEFDPLPTPSASTRNKEAFIEAKGEAYGTNIWTRTYRGDSSYSGVHRVGWS